MKIFKSHEISYIQKRGENVTTLPGRAGGRITDHSVVVYSQGQKEGWLVGPSEYYLPEKTTSKYCWYFE